MSELAGKVFAVTGAGSGIGRALALELHQRGARVAINDWDADGLDETAALLEARGAQPHVAVIDVADRDMVEDWAETVVAHFGGVNGIVNNAGVSLSAMVETVEYDDFEWVMNIDFWGVVYGTKAFLPHLKKSGDGWIVNVSSVFGLIGVPTQSAYNAAKFAVRGFTESLRTEMLATRAPVAVCCVHPGGIKTNIARNSRVEAGQSKDHLVDEFENELTSTTADRAAQIIADGMERRRPRILVGLDAHLIEKANRALPVSYQKIVERMFSRRNKRSR